MRQTAFEHKRITVSRHRMPTILVVDADQDTRALYCQSLTHLGCDVVEACDGRDALSKAFGRPLALVITEIMLPFVDGYALCEILRRDRTTADVPILVVTTEARPHQIDRVRQAGADCVLTKPTMIDRIVSDVRRLVADPRGAEPSVAVNREDEA